MHACKFWACNVVTNRLQLNISFEMCRSSHRMDLRICNKILHYEYVLNLFFVIIHAVSGNLSFSQDSEYLVNDSEAHQILLNPPKIGLFQTNSRLSIPPALVSTQSVVAIDGKYSRNWLNSVEIPLNNKEYMTCNDN